VAGRPLTLDSGPGCTFPRQMSGKPMLTIGQVAQRARVRLDTVRYYERRGLLPAPPRTPSGYRQYAPETVRRVAFIKRAQALGFTLGEIHHLLSLRVAPGTGCTAVERSARSAMERLDHQLADLHRMRAALARLADACGSQHATDLCPLLDAIEPQEDDETAD
jgi:Hg(II)-responsive transcriptional regulator